MIAFTVGLSTQYAMKLIKHQIIYNNSRDLKAILGLNPEKAFDNLSHEFILETISDLYLGPRFHAYVSSFLTNRTATLKIGELTSQMLTLGNNGTPQGPVI